MLTEITQAEKKKKKIPDGTLDQQEEVKNIRTDKYMSKYKMMF